MDVPGLDAGKSEIGSVLLRQALTLFNTFAMCLRDLLSLVYYILFKLRAIPGPSSFLEHTTFALVTSNK